METLVPIAIVLGMIALGALMLHLLNTQRAERIANHHYTPSRPRRGKKSGKPGRPTGKGPARS